MTNTKTIIGGVLAALALVIMGFYAALSAQHALGVASVTDYTAGVKWFGGGLYVGSTQQFGVDGNGIVSYSTTTQNGLQSVITPVSCVANSAATSTAGGLGATSYTAGLASCSGYIEWQR